MLAPTAHVPGTAIYIPVCSPKHCCADQTNVHHLTLAHLTTRNKKIVAYALERINNCIRTNHHLTATDDGKVVDYEIGTIKPNSTLLKGNVEKFKFSLDSYLRNDPKIAPFLSQYRKAHIDRYGRDPVLYKQFHVEDLQTMHA